MYRSSDKTPHIVLLLPRGEALRNFLYTSTLRFLSAEARVTVLSVITDEAFAVEFDGRVDELLPLTYFEEHKLLAHWRHLVQEAHFYWLDSAVARNHWQAEEYRAQTENERLKRFGRKVGIKLLANRPTLRRATRLERRATLRWRPNDHYRQLFERLQPDIVFNGSQFPLRHSTINLPINSAHELGIATAAFIFSWDNLTSRSRILEPYDYYFVWNRQMRNQLLAIYPEIDATNVFAYGTPQFEFHFRDDYRLTRAELAQRIGFDPQRPYILYTTGIDRHFPAEHVHVQYVIDWLRSASLEPRPQLVVRNYIKGISPQLQALAQSGIADVYFPPMQWEERWRTPTRDDQLTYVNLVRHCAMGVNAASTVSLELALHDKPIMNIGFDPPGSDLPYHLRWSRHIEFDHYSRVVDIGGVSVAWSQADMDRILWQSLTEPERLRAARAHLIDVFFDGQLDGNAGRRIAERLLQLAGRATPRVEWAHAAAQ